LFADSGWRAYRVGKCDDGRNRKSGVRVFGFLDAKSKKLSVFLNTDKTVGDFILDREPIQHQSYWLNWGFIFYRALTAPV
jgi:hypothetical protein